MPNPYSIELRNQVIAKYTEGKDVTEIVNELNVKKSFVYNMLKSFKATGHIPVAAKAGRKPTVNKEVIMEIERIVAKNPDMTWQELKDYLGIKTCIAPTSKTTPKPVGEDF